MVETLSPFLFNLAVNVLSRLVSTRVDKGLVEEFKVDSESFHLLHLQIVHDMLFFAQGRRSLSLILMASCLSLKQSRALR